MKPFVVDRWSRVFLVLKRYSPFRILERTVLCSICAKAPRRCRFNGTKSDGTPSEAEIGCIEARVVWYVLVAVGVFLFAPYFAQFSWLVVTLLIVMFLRTADTVVYQVNVIVFDAYRAKKTHKDKRVWNHQRSLILASHNFVEILLWFAAGYRMLGLSLDKGALEVQSWFDALNLSFVTMTSFGTVPSPPKDTIASKLIFCQEIVGVFMLLVVLTWVMMSIPLREAIDDQKQSDKDDGTKKENR